jgi:hypothetical protein
VTWDRVGKLEPAPAPTVAFNSASYAVDEDGGSVNITVTRAGASNGTVSVDWATSNGSATAGSDYTAGSGTLNFSSGQTSKTFSVSISNDGSYEGDETVNLTLSNASGGELGSPGSATLTISEDDPAPTYSFSGTVTANGAPLSGVSISDSNGATCSDSNGSGAFSCTLDHGTSGTLTASLSNYQFSPASISYSNITANQTNQDFTASEIVETAWYDDATPSGAALVGTWNWVTSSPAPHSGSQAHQSPLTGGIHRHYFHNPSSPFALSSGDTLFVYTYLDASNPPREIMLQFNVNGSWNQRAYWGENLIPYGTNGTSSRKRIGDLPSTGGWVRLEVPVAAVGLAGKNLNGVAFTLYDGRVTWDRFGKYVIIP